MAREDYGLGPDGFVIDSSLLREFPKDHPEWEGIAGHGLSYESAIMAEEAGAPPPTEWAELIIHGSDDGSEGGAWAVTITDDDGTVYHVDLGEISDLAWDFWDAADIYDYDAEKDIDTGSPD